MVTVLKSEKRNKGLYRRMSLKIDGQTKRVSLGYIVEKTFNQLVTTVEELESIRYVGGIIPQSLNEKITKLSPDIRDKLFDCGLLAERNPITVKDLFENFISYKLKTADPRSVRNYRSTLNTFQDYVGADTRIDRVTVGELKEFLADLNGKKEPSTIANYIKRTSAAFAHAVDNDWITYSPFTKLKEKRAYQVKKSEAKKQAQEKLLTIDVINKLLTCRKIILDDTENREWNSLTWVLRWTGCRIGEACILRWEDIDFDGNQISMRGKRKGVIGITSTDMRIRLMPFWKPLRPLLEDLKANSKSSFLFNKIGNLDSKPEFDVTDKEGNVLKHGRYSTNLQTTFKKILKRNELEAWPAPFHAIRSFRINELERDSRYRTVEVREWTGNSEQVAAKFYSAVTADDRMKAAQD